MGDTVIYSPLTAISQDPTGWDDPTLVTESYDSTNRVVTVSGTGKLYWQGRLVHDLAGGNLVSAAHTATNGGWFYYYNGTAYVWSQTAWTFNQAMICYVNYVSATPANSWALRECHSYMGWQTHRELHNTLGTARLSGGDLTAIVLNSTTASERRPAVAATVLLDEDLQTTATALSAGTYTQAYIAASSVATFVTGAADIVPLNTAVPRWNNATTGALTDFTANQYGNVWLIAMPTTSDAQSLTYRYLWLTPQAVSTTLATINGETPAGLNLGTLTTLSAEFVFIARVMVRFVSGNWVVISVTNLYGTRFQQTGSSAAPVDLSGYAPLAGATFTGTVQEEAQHVDKHLTTITLPAAGYNSLITLSTGERRMKLPDGTELADFVRLGPADYSVGCEFAGGSATSATPTSLGGMVPTAWASGTFATLSSVSRFGVGRVQTLAGQTDSGYGFDSDFSAGTVFADTDGWVCTQGFQLSAAASSAKIGMCSQFTSILAGNVSALINVASRVVTGSVTNTTGTSGTSPTNLSPYTLTAGLYYEAVIVKSNTALQFAILSSSGTVLWRDTGSIVGIVGQMEPGIALWLAGASGGSNVDVGLIDYVRFDTLAAWRKRTGVAALPIGASLLTFY